jgi:hypothetical protein
MAGLHVPLQKEKILGRVQELRGGKLNGRTSTRECARKAYAEHMRRLMRSLPQANSSGKPRLTP